MLLLLQPQDRNNLVWNSWNRPLHHFDHPDFNSKFSIIHSNFGSFLTILEIFNHLGEGRIQNRATGWVFVTRSHQDPPHSQFGHDRSDFAAADCRSYKGELNFPIQNPLFFLETLQITLSYLRTFQIPRKLFKIFWIF